MQQCLPLAVLKQLYIINIFKIFYKLQQCLPLAVLKPVCCNDFVKSDAVVATVPTACGIETIFLNAPMLLQPYGWVATVPTACGIETPTHVVILVDNL